MPHSPSDRSAQEAEILRLRQEVATLKDQLAQRPLSGPGRGETIFRAVYDQAQHLAGILDPAGTLQHANRVACALIGRTAAEIVGKPFWETLWWNHSPAEQAKIRGGVARAARGENVHFETAHPAADGALHVIEFSVRPAVDDEGDVVALIVEGWDISKRRQTEEALERTHLLLDAVLDQSPVPMIAVSAPDLVVRYLNRAAVATLGIADEPSYQGLPLPAAVARRTWQDLHLDGTPVTTDELPLVRALQGEATGNVEHVLQRKDGTRCRVLAAGTPIYNREGALLAGVTVFQDVTEYRQALEQIRQMANEQRTILNTITTGLCLLKSRRLQWFNPAFAAMFGYTPTELAGVEVRQFYADTESFERVGSEGYARLAEGGCYSAEVLQKRKDGTTFWCGLSGRSVGTQNLDQGAIWALYDITERRRAEEALRMSEARLETAQAQARIGSWEYSPATGAVVWSKEMFRLVGLDPENGPPSLEAGLELMHPDDRAHIRQISRTAAESGKSLSYEYRSNPAQGPLRYFFTTLEFVRDSAGQLLHIDGTLQEITERKNAERERAKLQEQLQQAMKMEAVGRLAGGVAHDFNNLLTVITGNVELARTELAPADPLDQYLAEVAKAAESAATLTRQLLAFSRRQIIEPKVLSLNELVENLRKMLHRLIGEDIELRTALAADLGSVKADPGQFDQVVVNLAINARDAMPDGGQLTIQTTNVELDESYCRRHADAKPGSYVMLAVSDTGQGMSPEVQQRLFEPFFTTKPKGRGTGLGLAMIFGVVKQAGGTIEVYSEIGKGTTFKIYLPRIEEPAERLARTAASSELPRGHETVLLVEDEASVRDLATAFLRRQGYKVLVAANGGEAFLLAERRAEPIDLLLTDVVMPGMNGRELSERILGLHPEIAVLFTSGYTEDMIVHHGVMDEYLHFIGKPYSLQAIARKVREVLDARPGHGPGAAPVA